VYTDEELRRIAVPTLLLIGEREVIYDPRTAIDRARRWIANLEAALVPGANHGLPMEQAERVNKQIVGFLAATRSVAS
jgi:pimeloyl-ACP methyl ester carboxylesterase